MFGVILLLVLAVGTYLFVFHFPGKTSKLEKETKRVDAQLQNTPDLINTYNDVSHALAAMLERWSTRSKDIPTKDLTAQTYAYLNRIMDMSGFVKMDMIYVNAQNRKNFGFNVYTLKGEGTFENLYRFLWYIENGRRLYKINSITLKGNEVKDKEQEDLGSSTSVLFEIELHAFYSSMPELASSVGWRDTIATPPSGNPFLAAISTDVPPNTRGLLEVERADLKAIISGKAFILDQTGVIRTLTEGDEVYLGYVSEILPEQGKVEFTLNKGGIVEKYEMRIRVESSITK